jgi:predicted Ser/Thr protein kinase
MDVPHIIAGRFRIECEIGRGGMGTVYRATHLGLERPVAVKIIKQEFAADQDVADRFMREARTMAKLRHQHAAMIFDAGNLPDGRHFIVMEFVEGQTLSDTLLREGRFAPERAVRIAADICAVLSEAHQLGIIHRDLKPSNIMLNERGVCVLDFGVAKVLATSADATATHATTGSGMIVGTPRYMSPEQCLGHGVGARSDLYSLGVLLYEMLAGRPPFVDALPSAVLVKQATAAPPPLPQLRTDVPHSLAVAIHTLLAKRPEHRPQTAEAARRLLEKSIVRQSQAVTEEQPFAATVAALNTPHRVVFRAVTPVAIVAVLGLALLIWGRGGQIQPAAAAALRNDTQARANSSDSTDSTFYAARPPIIVPAQSQPPLSVEAARQIVRSMSHDAVGDVRVVKTDRDEAIVALHDERREGTSHLFVVEPGGGGQYRITSRAALDAPEFRGATWSATTLDADGDGYDELLYTGTNPREHAADRRFLLYVPRTRQSYALRVENRTGGQKPSRITLSANAQTAAATPYRNALQHHAMTGN